MLLAEAAAVAGAADYLLESGGLYSPGNPMYGAGLRRLLAYNSNFSGRNPATRTYAPITLNHEWPTLWRLVLMSFFCALGTIINGFFISSFFIENQLKKAGNVYLACVGLADMIVTTVVMPVAIVVLISGVWENATVCNSLQLLTQISTSTYSLFFMMVAIETYLRLCRTRACYKAFMQIPVAYVSLIIFAISSAASATGVYLGMDYNYYSRESFGNYTYRLISMLAFHAVPFLVTMILFIITSLTVRARAHRLVHYRRSQQYERDHSFTNLNMGCFSLFVIGWLPYLIIVNWYPATTDSNFYNCVWIGLARSVFTSFLYCALNRNFRRAFSHLFYYCCCKSSLTADYNNHHRRPLNVPTGDVRMHILQCSMASPQRNVGAGCSRGSNTLEL